MASSSSETHDDSRLRKPAPLPVRSYSFCVTDSDSDSAEEVDEAALAIDDIECRQWTNEEKELYRRSKEESEGFDLPILPYDGALGRLSRIPDHRLSPAYSEFKLLCESAQSAIEHFNSHNKTSFEFVQIEKACRVVVAGYIYYLTFKVKPVGMPEDYTTTCLQAIVYYGISKIETKSSRIKPEVKSEAYDAMLCC